MGCRAVIFLTVLVASATAIASAEVLPAWPSVDEAQPSLGGGESDAAVIVGIDQYAFLPRISGAAANASAWHQWLLRTRGVAADRVSILRDTEATRERILGRLVKAREDVGPDGTLWVVFIGHGAPASTGDDGLVLGADAQQDLENMGARGIAQDEILRSIAGGAQRHTVVVFDACFSGRTGDGSSVLVPGVQATVPVRRTAAGTATVLSASDSFAGPLPGVERPAFSYLLLGALRGWGDLDADGGVSLNEAFTFTARALTSALRGENRAPSMRGNDSGLLVRATPRRIDVASIVLGNCPPSQRWDGSICEERCTTGASWNGSTCVARSVACPRGMRWDGHQCKPSVSCPTGTVFNAGECIAERVECPAGSTWTGGECRASQRHVIQAATTASVAGPATTSGPAWTWIGASAGVVGAAAFLGGGAWLWSSNGVMESPTSSGLQKQSAESGQIGAITLVTTGALVGVTGAVVAVLAAPGEVR